MYKLTLVVLEFMNGLEFGSHIWFNLSTLLYHYLHEGKSVIFINEFAQLIKKKNGKQL